MTLVQLLAIAAAVCLFFRPGGAYTTLRSLTERYAARRRRRTAELEHAAELERLWAE